MFGLFKRKEKEDLEEYYHVNINDLRTVAQLRESIKIIMKCMAGQDVMHLHISESKLYEYPHLSKVAKKAHVETTNE